MEIGRRDLGKVADDVLGRSCAMGRGVVYRPGL
jgi:hypothetical protein